MGNTSAVPIKQGETVVDYLRRKFKSKTRKPDNLVSQELREEEAEELADQEPLNIESLRRINALRQDQASNDPMQLQLVPVLPGAVMDEDDPPPLPCDQRLVPHDQRMATRDHHIATRDQHNTTNDRVRRPQGSQGTYHRPPDGHIRGEPYRARMMLQESTNTGSRTYSQDVAIDGEFVEERICYEEVSRRRRSRVVVRDLGDEEEPTVYTGSRYTPTNTEIEDLETQTRSRFSRFRQMTMNFFRGRSRRREEENLAIENNVHGDYMDRENQEKDQTQDNVEIVVLPGSRTSSRSSQNDDAEQGTKDETTENRGTARKDAGNIRRKSGDVAVQKGPDRGIKWPKRMEDIYSQTDKAYYIEQFQRTELFRQRIAKKEQGKTNWLMGLTPFQTWVLENLDTPAMKAILKPKAKARPNNAKAKVNCWRKDKPTPKRRHKMEE